MNDCAYKDKCRQYSTSNCTNLCPLYTLFNSLMCMSGIPLKYRASNISDIDGECSDIIRYMSNPIDRISNNIGLYIYSEKTGNGKTFKASIIAKEFVKHYAKSYLTKSIEDTPPVMFVKFSDFHNVYIQQFRDSEVASKKYYRYKDSMKISKVLIIDDLGIRDLTDALEQEFYEIINTRYELELLTIITSNIKLDKIKSIVGKRVHSRLCEITSQLEVFGEDRRQL